MLRALVLLTGMLIASSGFAFNGNLQTTLTSKIEQASRQNRKLQQFYKQRNYAPAWITSRGWTACAQKALAALNNAESEGLDRECYARALRAAEGASISASRALFAEIELTKAFIRYIDDVRNGRFNPRLADRQLVMKPDPVNPVQIMIDGFSTGGCNWIDRIPPQYVEYKALKRLRRVYSNVETPRLPHNSKLKLGGRSPNVIILRRILGTLGDLPRGEMTASDLFDTQLEYAVKQFQRRHGQEDDGIIGPKTLRALNTSPKDRLQKIDIALERWRWMPRNPGRRYIRVNIPGFELEAVENGRIAVHSPIIVGLAYRETPVFSAPMTGVIFNPSWHVPKSIAVKDKLKKIRRDPSYLTRGGYVVYRSLGGGRYQRVSPHSVNWSGLSRSYFPYKLRQVPGRNNALGQIRFTILNNFRVFLHDTSRPQLFEKAVRTFSSGCIRVKKPVELAQFVFNDNVKWSRAAILQEMEGNKTKHVNFQKRLPVHVTYFTTWVDQSGRPHFVDDIYGQDKQVLKVLKMNK